MKIARIKETCIYVADLDKAREFYNGKLGLEVISQVKDRHVFFRAGESVLLCFIAAQTEKEEVLPPHGGYGSIHFAFEVSGNQYEAARESVGSKGIEILHEQSWKGGLRSFYFHDPDKNLVEIIEEGLWDRY
jgi:catechol 2,3-dioxygenase-like lactoylglutathione lyase family enzyme